MTEKRGHPKTNKNILDVNGLLLEYIVTKTDKYDNEVSYFKVIDKNYKFKTSSILKRFVTNVSCLSGKPEIRNTC